MLSFAGTWFHPRFLVGSALLFNWVLCVVLFVMIVLVLRRLYPMLPVSVDFQFLIVPSVFSNVYLQYYSQLIFFLVIFLRYLQKFFFQKGVTTLDELVRGKCYVFDRFNNYMLKQNNPPSRYFTCTWFKHISLINNI